MKLAMTAVLVLCLALGGCSSNNILVSLNVAVATTDALVISLGASGQLDSVTAAQIIAAISPLPSVSQQIVAEMASGDTDTVRAAKITAMLSPVLAGINALPPTARAVCGATLAAWQAFLTAYQIPTSAMRGAALRSTKFAAKDLDKLRDKVFDLTSHAAEMRP